MSDLPYRIASAFLVSLIVSGVAAPLVYRMLVNLGSRQKISEHVTEHAHKQGTPTMGGLMILAGWIAGILVCFPLKHTKTFLGIIVLFAAIGFADDYVVPRMWPNTRGLGWKQKLILQIGGTAAILYGVGYATKDVAYLTFLVLFFSNAYNFADGMDALAGSLAVILATTLGVFAIASAANPWVTPHVMFALVGGLVPFLFFNAPPAKVFMGDVGALPIGAALGFAVGNIPLRSEVMAWQLWVLPLTLLSLVMIIELLPVPIQIAGVKILKRRIFPRTPIHHAFQIAGWPETRVVMMFVLVQFVCAALAFLWVMLLTGRLS